MVPWSQFSVFNKMCFFQVVRTSKQGPGVSGPKIFHFFFFKRRQTFSQKLFALKNDDKTDDYVCLNVVSLTRTKPVWKMQVLFFPHHMNSLSKRIWHWKECAKTHSQKLLFIQYNMLISSRPCSLKYIPQLENCQYLQEMRC